MANAWRSVHTARLCRFVGGRRGTTNDEAKWRWLTAKRSRLVAWSIGAQRAITATSVWPAIGSLALEPRKSGQPSPLETFSTALAGAASKKAALKTPTLTILLACPPHASFVGAGNCSSFARPSLALASWAPVRAPRQARKRQREYFHWSPPSGRPLAVRTLTTSLADARARCSPFSFRGTPTTALDTFLLGDHGPKPFELSRSLPIVTAATARARAR